MRSSIFTSFAMSMLTFMGTAEASVTPEVSATIDNILRTHGDTGPGKTLLSDKGRCDRESNDRDDWALCLDNALNTYNQAVGIASTNEPYFGEPLPVSTNTADAIYEYPADDERKGFLQAKEK